MFKDIFTEAHKAGEVQSKDWDRMMDLVLAGKDGKGIASKIKDKNKAIARYVAGAKIEFNGREFKPDWSDFESFADKAIELGATKEEIQVAIDTTEIPTKVLDKYKLLKTKELDNRFIGVISKAILKLGFDINFIGKGGNAITWEGKDAMDRNGRKWTIGYKSEITAGDTKLSFIFDAITDESVDVTPTYYVVDELRSLTSGEHHRGGDRVMGQRKFLAWLTKELGQYN